MSISRFYPAKLLEHPPPSLAPRKGEDTTVVQAAGGIRLAGFDGTGPWNCVG